MRKVQQCSRPLSHTGLKGGVAGQIRNERVHEASTTTTQLILRRFERVAEAPRPGGTASNDDDAAEDAHVHGDDAASEHFGMLNMSGPMMPFDRRDARLRARCVSPLRDNRMRA